MIPDTWGSNLASITYWMCGFCIFLNVSELHFICAENVNNSKYKDDMASYIVADTCACMLSRFSHVSLFVTLWTVARLAPLSMGFSRQEYWSGLLCPPPEDLPNPGIEPTSLCLQLSRQTLYPLSHLGIPMTFYNTC